MGVYWACAHFTFQRLLVSLSVSLPVILGFASFVLFFDISYLADEIIVCMLNIDNSFFFISNERCRYKTVCSGIFYYHI